MPDKTLQQIHKRLTRLEKAVFGKGEQAARVKPAEGSDYTGATGGIRFLVSKGFFNKKRQFGEIRVSLAGNDYHYSAQAVQMAVNRLASKGGPLIALKEGGKKMYVKRK